MTHYPAAYGLWFLVFGPRCVRFARIDEQKRRNSFPDEIRKYATRSPALFPGPRGGSRELSPEPICGTGRK